MLPAIDLTVVQTALEKRDAKAFASLVTELGIDLAFDAFYALVTSVEPRFFAVVGRTLLQHAYAALHDEHGFSFEHLNSRTYLVVRTDKKLLVGLIESTRSDPFMRGSRWPMGRWFKDAARNRATVDAWAAIAPTLPNVVVANVTRAPAPVVPARDRANGDALLAAVLADPDDAGARLVYADWLLEQGDVRGEIMRLAAEGERERRTALLSSQSEALIAPVKAFTEGARFPRGLIEEVSIFAKKLVRNAPALFDHHPITKLGIIVMSHDEYAGLGKIAPRLARVRDMFFESRRTPRVIGGTIAAQPGALAATGAFAGVRRLQFRGIEADVDAWETFFTTLDAPELRTFAAGEMPPAAIAILARSAVLPQVREIELAHQRWARVGGAADVVELAKAFAKRKGLERLSISSWHPGSNTMVRLVREVASNESLVDLAIENCTLGDNFLVEIAANADLSRLRRLHLGGRGCTPEGLAAFLRSKAIGPQLRELVIDREGWQDETTLEPLVAALVAAPSTLERVVWSDSTPTADQRARIAATRTLR